jgi:hypothetical protein
MTVVFLALLFWSLLAMWTDARWPWAIFQIGVFALAGVRVLRARRVSVVPAAALLAGAAAWPLVQVLAGRTVSAARTSEAALQWLGFAVTFVLARGLWDDRNERRRALRIISTGGMLLAAVSVLQQSTSAGFIFWTFPSGYSEGVWGPFVNRNQFAAWIELIFPVAAYLALTEGRGRALHLCAAATLAGAMAACASRAGMLLLVLEAVRIAVLAAARRLTSRRRLAWSAVQLAVLAAASVAAAGWRPLAARFGVHGPELLRREAYRASLDMIRARPWDGYGLGTWSMVYPRYASFDSGLFLNQAHNDWLQWAAEGGLPFLAILIAFAALLWKPAIRSIYGIGTVVLLLHALVDYPMQQRPALAAWFFAACGAAMASRKGTAPHDGLLRGTGGEPDRFG